MNSHKMIRILLGTILVTQALSVSTSYGMEESFFSRAGKAAGKAMQDFTGGMGSGFTGFEGLNTKKITKAVNSAVQGTIEAVKDIDTGPAVQELWALIKQNRDQLILYSIYVTIGSTAVSAVSMGVLYATYYGWKYGSEILAKYILMRMEKPRVIINSSTIERPNAIRRLFNLILKKKPTHDEMIFAPELEQQLDDIVKQTNNINTALSKRKKNITYRNLLLWGPPGTGKTMFARQLARKSNLEWVEVTGSSFFTKGAGIAAIDELFEWANNSKHGLLIFIDEADSLLPDRSKMDPNSDNYKIINHFLNYLGTKSNKFMIVMSTNHKIVFDQAMRRRIHDSIQLPLPSVKERMRILNLYAQKSLFNTQLNGDEFVLAAQKTVTANKIQEIATQTDGFSGDELATLIETIKSLADISEDGMVTTTIVERAIKRQLEGRQGFLVAGPTAAAAA